MNTKVNKKNYLKVWHFNFKILGVKLHIKMPGMGFETRNQIYSESDSSSFLTPLAGSFFDPNS